MHCELLRFLSGYRAWGLEGSGCKREDNAKFSNDGSTEISTFATIKLAAQENAHGAAHRIPAADPRAGHGGPAGGGGAVGAGRAGRGSRLQFDLGRRFDPGPAPPRAADPHIRGRRAHKARRARHRGPVAGAAQPGRPGARHCDPRPDQRGALHPRRRHRQRRAQHPRRVRVLRGAV